MLLHLHRAGNSTYARQKATGEVKGSYLNITASTMEEVYKPPFKPS